jgi:hypothetical protein
MTRTFPIVAAAAILLWLTDPGAAYRLNGPRWASGSRIVMHLQQGSSSGALIDGSPDWNAVSEGALGTWNSFLGNVSFGAISGSSAGVTMGNGVNNVAWADDMYGEAFGSTIAVAFWRSRNGVMTEVDVLFDRGRNWNSYRGNLRGATGGGTLYDLRRVALHEFGHVLGLGHPDEQGESVNAIMNSRIGHTDALQPDDTNGARALYGVSTSIAPAPSNRAPTVTASCTPCTVEAERTSTLRASASDPDGDSLSYEWSAPEGAFTNANAADAAWTAPRQEQTVTATVTVRDGRGGSATATVAVKVIPRDKLIAGARLLNGQSLVSANLRYRLAFQGDGNLVLYDDQERKPLWASNTGGISPGEAAMQGDGNAVVYDAQGKPHWSTGTVGNANAYLLVQNDGNLVAYSAAGQAIWNRSR